VIPAGSWAVFGGKRQAGPLDSGFCCTWISPYPHAVPDSSDLTPRQRRAAAALLRGPAMAMAGLARRFAAEGYELALVGGSVRDVFLGRRHGDLDLATDARPGEVRQIAAGWADTIWDTGIEFGTVGLRREVWSARSRRTGASNTGRNPTSRRRWLTAGRWWRTWSGVTSQSTP